MPWPTWQESLIAALLSGVAILVLRRTRPSRFTNSFGVVAAGRHRYRRWFLARLVITILVVSATGHHWWLDGFVGVGFVGLAWLLDRWGRRRLESGQVFGWRFRPGRLTNRVEGGRGVVALDGGERLLDPLADAGQR